jgi:hypothetical protein
MKKGKFTMTKTARELSKKIKNFFTKVGETRIWRILFISKIDMDKVDELKRETMIKYWIMRF